MGEPVGRRHVWALDLVRGVAAILVVLGHSRELLLGALGLPLTGSGPGERIILAPTSFAMEAVAVFFVLSGYLVGGSLIHDVQLGRFGWRRYLSNRVSRLSTVLIPGLAVTLALDSVRRAIWHTQTGSLGPKTFLCNAAFLQGPYCTTYGSNASLWSISYEFWFYIVAAGVGACVLGLRKHRLMQAGFGLIVAIATVAMFGVPLLLYIPAWVLGALLSLLVPAVSKALFEATHATRSAVLVGSLAVLMAGMLASNILALQRPAQLLLVGLAASPLTLLMASGLPGRAPTVIERLGVLGRWSYSIYIFHVPIVLLVISVMLRSPLSEQAAVGEVYGIALVAVAVSVGAYGLFERHTLWVRKQLFRVFGVSQDRRVLPQPVQPEAPSL